MGGLLDAQVMQWGIPPHVQARCFSFHLACCDEDPMFSVIWSQTGCIIGQLLMISRGGAVATGSVCHVTLHQTTD